MSVWLIGYCVGYWCLLLNSVVIVLHFFLIGLPFIRRWFVYLLICVLLVCGVLLFGFGLLVWFDCVGALVLAQVVGWWLWV